VLCVLVKRFGSAKQAFHEFLNVVIATGDEALLNVGLGWWGGGLVVVFSCTSFVTSLQVEFLNRRVGASHFHSISVVGLVDETEQLLPPLTRDVQSRSVLQLC